jgi:hypothetical protein
MEPAAQKPARESRRNARRSCGVERGGIGRLAPNTTETARIEAPPPSQKSARQ